MNINVFNDPKLHYIQSRISVDIWGTDLVQRQIAEHAKNKLFNIYVCFSDVAVL